MAVYLNTYEVHQAYGGPEEGGWWFDCGTPVQSILLSPEPLEEWLEQHSDEYLSDLRQRTTAAFSCGKEPTPRDTGYGGYTFLPGSDDPVSYLTDNNYITAFEEDFAKPYPETRPYYS